MTAPNQFQFTGDNLRLTYYPDGAGGPIEENVPETYLFYQHATETKAFGKDELIITEDKVLGSIVSVYLSRVLLFGTTTLSVIVPDVELSDGIDSIAIRSIAFTELAGRLAVGPPQESVYTVYHLRGTAAHVLRPGGPRPAPSDDDAS